MKIIGLTGSIGMGKSVTSTFFQKAGVPVFDADACVHALYRGRAVDPVRTVFPDAIVNNCVSREILSSYIMKDPDTIRVIENIIHPLVHDERQKFITHYQKQFCRFLVLDIPLLFEKKQDALCDVLCIVSAPLKIQRERVLARPDMTVEKFEAILARQLPDAEKRKRAHYVITSTGFEKAQRGVADIVRAL